MINEDTITLKMKRIDLLKLMAACTSIELYFVRDANKAKTDGAKISSLTSANMWASLHDRIEAQLND